jgi:hypothetical protein
MEITRSTELSWFTGQRVEMHSLDGETWSSDLSQLHGRMRAREKQRKKALRQARRIFPKGIWRTHENYPAVSKIEFTLAVVGRWYKTGAKVASISRSKWYADFLAYLDEQIKLLGVMLREQENRED